MPIGERGRVEFLLAVLSLVETVRNLVMSLSVSFPSRFDRVGEWPKIPGIIRLGMVA